MTLNSNQRVVAIIGLASVLFGMAFGFQAGLVLFLAWLSIWLIVKLITEQN